ncbi:hypothetical protein [Saccharothrix sp.]|uniref:hypothetical protein n=1 Tax=Saccharothrix sp. TaxID=1873460 RepID=UPI0028113027|nr:hypothetical protein [Saccharothrix sp.]
MAGQRGALALPFTADPALGGAWGGPTLVGAWAVHAGLEMVMRAVCVLGLRLIYPRATGTARRR